VFKKEEVETLSEIDQIKLDEGFSGTAYLCSEGFLTIGYGYNLERFGAPQEMMRLIFEDVEWTEEKATRVLELTLMNVRGRLLDAFPWLTQEPVEIQNILLNMAYQMGVPRLSRFKNTLAAIQADDYRAAATEVMDSLFARQTPNRAGRARDRFLKLSGRTKMEKGLAAFPDGSGGSI
jgi:lysozyme